MPNPSDKVIQEKLGQLLGLEKKEKRGGGKSEKVCVTYGFRRDPYLLNG
jgi:hypothetical protein